MYLYLVQHGEAKPEHEDPSRPLTEKGTSDVRKSASFLKKINVSVSQILHSGKTRALQTAEIFANELAPQKLSQSDGLSPLDDPKIWGERLSHIKENIMLVGHLPHLSRLASLLLTGDVERTVINFRMGGVLCLKRNGGWAVEWMITPDIV